MKLIRFLSLVIVAGLLCSVQLEAQGPSGIIAGLVTDAANQQPLFGARVQIVGTQLLTATDNDGRFNLTRVPPGTHVLRVTRIGYGPEEQEVTIASGATASVEIEMEQAVALLEGVVVTGYGTQSRESITGSIATIDVEEAEVGVVSNVNDMIQGRAAGVNIVRNSGEPGAAVQIRVRGGTSISASNEPLYVIDGVPIQNVSTEAGGVGDLTSSLARSPLALLNPSDIASITILKDASASAIYGSRGANGVVLIETKKGASGGVVVEYDGYVAVGTRARSLDVLNGEEYRQFVQEQVAAGNLGQDRLDALGTANTDWEREVTRTAITHNHNLTFSGGGAETRYRASLNYMNQEGVAISSGFERIQGRLSGTHSTWNDRLRLELNLTGSRVDHDYVPYVNTGGFEGAVLHNMVEYNPTNPVKVTDPETGLERYYEIGTGSQGVRNPVALAEQTLDFANTTRILGNVKADLELLPGVTAEVNVGVDNSDGTRRTYFPAASPAGAQWNGRARQVNRFSEAVTLQTLLTGQYYRGAHSVEVVGGYEFSDYSLGEFGAEGRDFATDAFSFNNLGGGNELVRPFSFREDRRLASFFGRVNYGLSEKYNFTGVLRYDGSSRFGSGNKWAVFPALSASWRISEEDFMRGGMFSELRLRAGWGLQGNEAVPPYASLITLTPGALAAFGQNTVVGVYPNRNPNPNLKWEQTSQVNMAVDFGLWDNRLSGSVEYFIKNTSDLLLDVTVPQPAVVGTRLENIGKVRNQGLEIALDAVAISRPNLTWLAGLVFSMEKNEVVDLGGRQFIVTGSVSGEGQSGNFVQRILPGEQLGTFWGPEFVGVNDQGQQLFNDYDVERDEDGREISRTLVGETTIPEGDDFNILGDANPDFTLDFRSQGAWGDFDFSFLVRSVAGMDVFNNTALVYSTKSQALTGQNFLKSALDDPTAMVEPAIVSSKWVEDGSFLRLQNITIGYAFALPGAGAGERNTRVYVSADNLLLLTGYSGYDPEVHTAAGLASRGIDYLNYPRPRTFTAGIRVRF
jgi:TonB-linked SusC/RagA family outer membrane protein